METNQKEQIEIIRLLTLMEHHLRKLAAPKLEWNDAAEICKLLKVSRRSLETYRLSGILHPGKLGGRVYYNIAEINNYLAASSGRKENLS